MIIWRRTCCKGPFRWSGRKPIAATTRKNWYKRPVTVIVRYKFVTISFMSGTNWLVQGIVSGTPKIFYFSSDRSFMVDPLSYFSFKLVLHNWCNKGHSMCYPVCGMVHKKELWLLIGKSSPCGSSGFPLSRYLSGPLPCVRRHITVNKMCWVRR